MAQATHTAGKVTPEKETIVDSKVSLTLDKVIVKERTIVIDIPRIVYHDTSYERPIVKVVNVDTTKYNVVEESTIKYNTVDKETIRYTPKIIECEKPVIKEVSYEKPIIKEQIYEKPVIETKKMTIITVENLHELTTFGKVVKELQVELMALKKQMEEIKNYRLVEKVIVVPKVEWTVVKAERIEWIPVKREMIDANSH